MPNEEESLSLDLGAMFANADFGLEAEDSTEEAPDAVTTPADEESAADEEDDEEAPEEAEAPAEEAAAEDDGPGNRKAALREAREELKALKANYAQTNARLAAIENERHQQQAAYQQQQQSAQIQAAVEQMHPDDVPAYLEQVQRQQAAQYQQQADQARRAARIQDSEEAARAALPDYDATIQKGIDLIGVHALVDWASQQQGSPAMAAYNRFKGVFTQSDIDAAEERGRKGALEALPAANRRQPSAPSLRNLTPAGRTRAADPQQQLTKQLAKGGDAEAIFAEKFRQAFGG